MSEKQTSLAATIKLLKSDFADAFEMDSSLEAISTGCLSADLVTGIGGFPRRRISEVFGWESSGKTTLCLSACAAAQRKGLFAAYIDVERGLDLTHARKIGFDWENSKKGLLVTPGTFEETFKIISALVQSGECDLIIADSVPGMVPEALVADDVEITHEGALGSVARLLASVLPRITKQVDKNNTALVLVNQMRHRIVTGFAAKYDHGPKEQAFGGAALRFYSSLRLETKLVSKGKLIRQEPNPLSGVIEKVEIGNRHRVTAIKNKVERPYTDLEFYLRYDASTPYGIDNVSTVLEMATVQGLITKAGNYFKYGGKNNFSVQSERAMFEHALAHPEVLAELCAALKISLEYVNEKSEKAAVLRPAA